LRCIATWTSFLFISESILWKKYPILFDISATHLNKKISKWCIIILEIALFYLYGKDNFAKVSKTLARYRFENNVVWTIKIIM